MFASTIGSMRSRARSGAECRVQPSAASAIAIIENLLTRVMAASPLRAGDVRQHDRQHALARPKRC